MKIAMVHPRLNSRGGAEGVVAMLYKELRLRGHHIDVYTRRYDPSVWPDETFREKDIHQFENALLRPSRFLSSRLYGRILQRYLHNYDVINAHNYPSTYWCYLATKKMSSRPLFVWYCEEPYRRLYRNITDKPVFDYEDYASGSN